MEPVGQRTKAEPDGAERGGRTTAEGPEVHGVGRVTSDKCGAGRMRGAGGFRWSRGKEAPRESRLVNEPWGSNWLGGQRRSQGILLTRRSWRLEYPMQNHTAEESSRD